MWTILFSLFLLYAPVVVEGQIRTGWNITAPCNLVANTSITLYGVTFLTSCDMWHAPHIANPFILMMWTRSWIAAFVVSGLFEILEALIVTIAKSFVVFPGAVNSYENIPDSLLDDWLIQGGLGTLLGAWVTWYFQQPKMWRGWFTANRGHFVQWLIWYILIMCCQMINGLLIDPNDPNAFPVGALASMTIMCILFAFLIQNEPGVNDTWHGRTRYERARFWVAIVAIYLSFYYAVIFDFFFGSAAQTWLLWGAWIIIYFISALIHGRGKEIIMLLHWQTTYLRNLAASKSESKI